MSRARCPSRGRSAGSRDYARAQRAGRARGRPGTCSTLTKLTRWKALDLELGAVTNTDVAGGHHLLADTQRQAARASWHHARDISGAVDRPAHAHLLQPA